MTHRPTLGRLFAAALIAALLASLPGSVAAHSALDAATPVDGATVDGTPPEVSGTYTQDIETVGSSIQLRDASGTVVATGGVDPDDPRRMVIDDLPELAPGDYEVRWTTNSAEDGELDRDTWSFTVAAAASAAPTQEPTDAASPSTAASPSAAPTPEPSSSASPSPSPAPTDPTSDGGDVVLPIIAGLAIVLIAAALLLSRRRRPLGGV